MKSFAVKPAWVAFWAILSLCVPALAQHWEDAEHPAPMMKFGVSHFSTEFLPIPEGIDTPRPQFAWKLAAESNGQAQSAYQLTVRNFTDNAVVWDSGQVESDQQTFVDYGGDDLAPATEYLVELTVWDKDGSEKDSITSCFSTGLWPTAADENPWKGKWIGSKQTAAETPTADLSGAFWIGYQNTTAFPLGKSVYRKSFEIDDPAAVSLAVANLTGDNHCRVFFNGEQIGMGAGFKLAPSFMLTEKLKAGKNTVALEVENVGDNPNPGGAVGAILIVEGEKKTEWVTDASWKCIEGSDESFFAVDFDDSAWKTAEQIAPAGEGPWGELTAQPFRSASIPARYLSKTVAIPAAQTKEISRAVAYIAGLGYYELLIDGIKVGDHVLDPILTEYDKRVPYNTYDVTDFLQYAQRGGIWSKRALDADENAEDASFDLGVILGNGRYYAPRAGAKNYGLPRMLFQLNIEYADGSSESVVSDESWKVSTAGPIGDNNDYDGEICDMQKAVPYDPKAENQFYELRFGEYYAVPTTIAADVLDAPAGKLTAQMMPPMRVNMELAPEYVTEVKPGVWVYDFGQNFVGWCRVALNAPAGTQVKMRFAETLQTEGDDAGMIDTANLRTALCRDIFSAASSDETQYYQPRFSYHGFRYVELTGYPGTPDLDTLVGCVVGTDLPLVGHFACNDPTITQFVKNIEWGTRGNYVSIPTDCPQRDERQGWQGDRAAESKGEMYLFNNITLYRKWMQDIEDSQRGDGNVSDVAPPYWELYSTNVTWPSAMTIVPESLRVMYGDEATEVKHYESRKKWLNHLATFIKEDGTIDKDNYGDWCVPPEDPILIHSKDPARKTNQGLLATAYYAYNLKLMAQCAERLGKAEDRQEFLDRAQKATDALNKVYYDAKKGQYDNGTQTSCVLPLAFGLVPKGQEQKVFDTLVSNIENVTDKHIGTGLIGGQWLNRVLSDCGQIDLSYTFATNRTYPSWGYMLEKGATTVWELWNGDTADPAMNSGNHVMLVGDLGIWYFEYLAGIKSDETVGGFKKIMMKPNIIGDLTWVDAAYDSVRGLVASNWELDRETGLFQWRIIVPVGSTALVSVPTTKADSVKVADFDLTESKAVDGRVEFTLESGTWEISSEWKK